MEACEGFRRLRGPQVPAQYRVTSRVERAFVTPRSSKFMCAQYQGKYLSGFAVSDLVAFIVTHIIFTASSRAWAARSRGLA